MCGLAAISALVLGGLSWATRSAVRLERFEAEEEARHEYEPKLFLVSAHLDSFIDNVLAMERTRPVEHYRAYFHPARMVNARSGLDFDAEVVLPSPLLTFDRPDWMLLHFQVSAPQKWDSPELTAAEEWAMPADTIPTAERARRATAANWLASLRERYDEIGLQGLLERATRAEAWAAREASPHDASNDEPARSETGAAVDSASEFVRRGRMLIELQKNVLPPEQCTPHAVVMKNLLIDEGDEEVQAPTEGCVMVSTTQMQPVWLRLTTEGEPQLALLRSVSVDTVNYCILQGVLIDWPRFRAMVERELNRLLPGATVEPVPEPSPADARDLSRLRSIPARLAAPPPPAVVFALSDGLRNGLIVAWSVTMLALAAIAYGAMKYVSILERRMQFAAAVTHELRTPLTSFQLYADLLADGAADEAARRSYVETLRREARRLGKLVENVLLYSRLGDAKPILHPRSVSPQELLEAVAQQTAETCRAAGKALVVENGCANGTTLTTDGEFVQQILANLVENACKYSGQADDNRIFLAAAGNGAHVQFDVEDAGPGVDPSERRAVFRPFRRGSPARDRATGGVGLGLALSRHWAECLGGQLALTRGSRSGGRYSRFVLKLPRELRGPH